MTPVGELASVSQIADDLGAARRTVHGWISRYPSFPAAAVETPAGRLYNLSEVRAWHDRHDFRPGRRYLEPLATALDGVDHADLLAAREDMGVLQDDETAVIYDTADTPIYLTDEQGQTVTAAVARAAIDRELARRQ